MNYCEHGKSIKDVFPELDLLKESEFYSFKNEDFALHCINSCVDLCNHVSDKFKITLYFAVQYNHSFNAKAIVKNNCGVILLNLGLIEKLESIVFDSIAIFSKENIAMLTIPENENLELKSLFSDLCLSYLFNHELAHILQKLGESTKESYNFQEQYSINDSFNIKNHIYELDADHFGVSISTIKLLKYALKISYPINTLLLFNLLTALLFSISNIIIEFSENQFETVYYKNFSHPHPIIRIIECNEQILSLTSKNLNIEKEFFLAILQRTNKMISQIKYSNKGQINYSKLVQDNFSEIENYIKEIETINDLYKELIRFRSQQIFNSLFAE